MAFADIALGVGIAAGVSSIGMGAASAAGAFTPDQPNLAAASAEQANAQASALPQMDLLQAAAQEGKNLSTLNSGYTQQDVGAYRQQLQSKLDQLNQQQTATPQGSKDGRALTSQISDLQNQLNSLPQSGSVYFDGSGRMVPASQATTGANFQGYGTADIQRQLLSQEAAGQLANAQEFDPKFIAEAAAQEALANPQGVKARQELYDQLQKQIASPPTSPVADEMNRQITERANAGSGLTPEELAALNKDVASMDSITGTSGNQPDFSKALTTGFEGQQRALGNAQAGGAFLASGESPDEVRYRAEEQNLSNLGDFIKGVTPESQFSELSGASTGPTPNYQAAQQPTLNMNAPQQGANAALTRYEQQLNAVNPWLAGVSGALNLGSTAANIFGG